MYSWSVYLNSVNWATHLVQEVARARVGCACTKFKELSPILMACGGSYHIKGKMFFCLFFQTIFSDLYIYTA